MTRIRMRPTQVLGALLFITVLTIAGCGGNSATPEATIAPTSTLIPTLAPLQVPTTEAEATATVEPVATEAAPAETPTEEVIAEETATEESATEEVVESEPITESESIAEAEPVTETEAVTTTEAITTTEEVTATEEAASDDAEEVTDPHAGHAITESAELSPSAEITGNVVITGLNAASEARLYFLQPTTNAIVPLTFTIAVSYTGVTVASTGHSDEAHGDEAHSDAEQTDGAGHLHLLVDTDFIEAGNGVPSDDLHIHLEDGTTSLELSLTPGSHILRLQYADSNHIALDGEQYRAEIYVNAIEGAPEQAVRIASPTSGATVPPTFDVVMAATGLRVERSRPVNEGAGHFHLLIDEPFVAPGEIIPVDTTHLHFGMAQLTTTLTLEPGTYLLRLQMADGEHRALSGDQYRAEIQVIVDEDAPAQQVMFVKPAGGATVRSPFLVGWAASGLIIESAGSVIRPEGGHLHILVDEGFIAAGEAIPTDETHLHYGRGQTSAELTLEPGEHTLRLQMANGAHLAQDGAQYQDEITVTVR